MPDQTQKPVKDTEPIEPAKRARLWVVTELYYPEETSTGYYLTRIAEGLANTFDTKAICGQPNYSARGIRSQWHETRSAVEIFRARGTTLDKDVILFRLVNMITLNASILVRSLSSFRKGDRVLVVTTPPLLPFTAAAASLFRGGSYILLIHDNYPELLVATKKTTEDGLFAKMLNYFNTWLYKHAAKIIVVGRDMRDVIERKTKGLDIPIAFIPNWAELETVEPQPRDENELLAELGLANKFVLLYAGNMGHPNDVKTIIEAAERLRENEDIHFIFLGNGVKEPWLRKRVQEYDLANVTILAPQPRSRQIVFLNACDVALVSLVSKMRGVSMPSRTYNFMAAGKPFVALTDQHSELAQVIDEEKIGWHIEPGDPEKLRDAIISACGQRNEISEMGKRARNAAVRKYSLETAIDAYREALK
jgi:glycosyltransferase involved in cell wall biosynthesis